MVLRRSNLYTPKYESFSIELKTEKREQKNDYMYDLETVLILRQSHFLLQMAKSKFSEILPMKPTDYIKNF